MFYIKALNKDKKKDNVISDYDPQSSVGMSYAIVSDNFIRVVLYLLVYYCSNKLFIPDITSG